MAGLKSYFPSSLYAPTATMAAFKAQTAPAAPSAPSGFVHPASAGFTAHSQKEYGLDYFLKGALAGGICCSVTHGALTPVDVVKTRMQLDPTKYTGMVSGFQKVIAEEGAGALLTGLGPTAFGYFIQGWFKFGGVEFFKIQAAKSLTPQETWDNRNSIYLGSSAAAEFIADIFLCPLEATRIRLVSNPSYADSMLGAMGKMASEEGIIGAFYSGFGPILAKQVPYTMAKFAVQGIAAEKIYDSLGKTPAQMSSGENISVSPRVRRRRRRRRGHHLPPRGYPPVEDQQGWRRRVRRHALPPRKHRRRDGSRQAVHAGARREVRDDRYPHRGTVRYLRHRHECCRRVQVPLPRPRQGRRPLSGRTPHFAASVGGRDAPLRTAPSMARRGPGSPPSVSDTSIFVRCNE